MKVPIGAKGLDDLLGGGIEAGAITEFYGEAGTGKTNICLLLARNVVRSGRKVVYIDSEGVSLERLRQVCGPDFESVQKNILFFEPYSLDEQDRIVAKATRLAQSGSDIGLIVMDSATIFYRLSLASGDDMQHRRGLTLQLHTLLTTARQKLIPVVITNQVYTNIDSDILEPIGGQLMRHISKAIIHVEKAGKGLRRATVVKHRSAAEGSSVEFVINQAGLGPPPEKHATGAAKG
ncbi:MAG: DNA repair and recombination protein RadB [Euryarchaeota archaeon]|nr:DNA repair and recombination protein RadB [Euryarchaeota archaeon]